MITIRFLFLKNEIAIGQKKCLSRQFGLQRLVCLVLVENVVLPSQQVTVGCSKFVPTPNCAILLTLARSI